MPSIPPLVREIFEVFYPEVLPGHAWESPDVDWANEVVPEIIGAMEARPRGARPIEEAQAIIDWSSCG